MYHRIGSGKHANDLRLFKEHLEALKDHFPLVLPGERLSGTSLLLTFDDASYDFYHHIFPLLEKWRIRALLGVPTRYILEKTDREPKERLAVPYFYAMQDGVFDVKAPLCTWRELETMVQSGLVQVASHSFAHKNLTYSFVNLEEEVIHSKRMLEERLPQAVTSFIYPFGRWNGTSHALVQRHYPYSFRIGSASNSGWGCTLRPLARVNCDRLTAPLASLSLRKRLSYWVKGLY